MGANVTSVNTRVRLWFGMANRLERLQPVATAQSSPAVGDLGWRRDAE